MEHEELLAGIDELPRAAYHEPYMKALRAVVELHEPIPNGALCSHCNESYPCYTISSIQDALK